MKTTFAALLLCLCLGLSAWAQKKDGNILPAQDGVLATVTLADGGVAVIVDSFGRAGHNSPGCGLGVTGGFAVDEADSVLCLHTDFFSTGGAVQNINPTNCGVINQITVDPKAANHATSAVQCGDCRFDFDQTVSNDTKNWTTLVAVSGNNCTLGCYYSYNDYDVHGFANNNGSFQTGATTLGQFVVRNGSIMSEVHYLFSDQSTAIHWIQDSYPTVLTGLSALTSCVDLTDSPPTFVGDWTAALQFPAGSTAISYSLGRDDTTSYP